jgi:hypothetical protein
MIDTKLITDALNKSSGQYHVVANHCTCYQGNRTRYLLNVEDVKSRTEADFHERVLRSFLVTGCIRTSEKIVKSSNATRKKDEYEIRQSYR